MFSKMQIHLFDMDNYLKLLSCRLTELHEAVDKPKSCYDIQGVSPAITVGNKMDTIIWILESSSLGQAGNNIEALALNEIIKEIMNSVYDKQKHPTEQNNPRSKCFCPGGYLYEQGQIY